MINLETITKKLNPFYNQTEVTQPVEKNTEEENLTPKGKWFMTGATVRGNSHIQNDTSCQDYHTYEMINEEWGIAIVADGAGSYKYSEKGSEFVAQTALEKFKALLEEKEWAKNNQFPEQKEWEEEARTILLEVQERLIVYAHKENLPFKELGCTVIVMIYSPKGLLVSHIGDGRAGYCNDKDEWKAAIDPFEGEQVGSTVFITLDIENNPELIRSHVIQEPLKAITLLSDGCERIAWNRVKQIEDSKFEKVNKPFADFYNAIISTFSKLLENETEEQVIKEKWANYLEKGHRILREEPDDKTMIVGFIK